MNIVVLCGGLSTERDVSIKSGTLIFNALKERGHNVVLIDSFFGYEGTYENPKDVFEKETASFSSVIGDSEPDLEAVKASRNQKNGSKLGDNVIEICREADIVFMAMHGEDGENGKIQALFDVEGIKYTGSGYLGSAIAMNKGLSKILFKAAGVGTADSITVYKDDKSHRNVGVPCVVKPCSGGSSVGVSIVNSEAEYEAALALSFKYEDAVIVEKYIKGRELTIGILDGEPMPIIEIIPKQGFYDYKNKYQAGLTEEICPAQISPVLKERIEKAAVKAYKALMIDTYCRIDFMTDEDENVYCLEANTLPGMTPTSLIPQMAAEMGMSYGQLCEKIIEISLKNFN